MKTRGLLSIAAALIAVSASFIGSGVAHAGTQLCTWTGAGTDSNWSTAANWSCDTGTVPADGAALVFPFDSPGTVVWGNTLNGSNNDLSTTNIYTSLSFNKVTTCANNYTVIGSLIRIAGTITTNAVGCGAGVEIHTDLQLESDTTISANWNISIGYSNPVALNGHTLTLTSSTSGLVRLGGDYGAVTGTGNLVATNVNLFLGPVNTFSGTISASNANLTVDYGTGATATPFGNSSNQINLGDQSWLSIVNEYAYSSNTRSVTIPQAISISGSEYAGYGGFSSARIFVGSESYNSGLFSFSADDVYYAHYRSNADVTFSGALTLASDLKVAQGWMSATFTGPISGGYTIAPAQSAGYIRAIGSLVVAGSSNSSLTPNGTYSVANDPTTLSDSLPTRVVSIGSGYTVIINGQRGCVGIQASGVLKGTGTVGCIESKGGITAPGLSPGILNSGNVTLDSASTLQAELGGTAAGEYDQLNVTGTVDLGSAILDTVLYNGYAPALNSTYTIINNDGVDAVTGTFAGLAQGASFAVDGYTYTISYTGGDGNDVVLTVAAVPAPPNTAGVFGKPANIALGAMIVLVGVALFATRHMMLKKAAVTRKK